MRIASIFAAVAAVVSAVVALDVGTLKGTLLPGTSNVSVRDPTIMWNPQSKKYFLFSTGKGFRIHTSPALSGPWTEVGKVLPNGPAFPVPGGVSGYWAPDIAKIDDTYVLSYTICEKGVLNYRLGLATSTTMEPGSWNDRGLVHESFGNDPKGFFAIDSQIIKVGNKVYMNYGSFIDGIFQITLDQNWKKIETTRGLHLAGKNNRPVEGPFMYKAFINDYYYLFISVGKTMLEGMSTPLEPLEEYHVRVGRSKSPNGPFVGEMGYPLTENHDPPTGNIVLQSHDNVYAPGGQSVYADPVSGRPIIVYHYVPRDKLGGPSYLGISYLNFTTGWPVVVRP